MGVVQRSDTGRPAIAYGKRCKQDQIEHEVRITDLALFYRDCPFDRDAKVGSTEADAFMLRNGNPCFIEVDNSGKMDARQMQAKWKRYEGVDGYILVVAVTERRMERLRKGAEAVKGIALFTTFERLQSGQSNPWVDWYGNATEI